MSGTFESAQLAARDASIRVIPVDTRQVGVATGYAALAAADVVDAGGIRRRGGRRPPASGPPRRSSLFYVDTLEYLRRGGRIGAAAALLGGALAVKPLLQIEDGKVASLERVRTSARALARLEELAVQAAGEAAGRRLRRPPRQPRAGRAAHREARRSGSRRTSEGREVWCGELGAVLGAHVGPGMIAVCVAPRR